MAAPMTRPMVLQMNIMLFHPIKTSGRFTYCRRSFYSRFIKEQSVKVKDNVVTKESRVDESVVDYLKQSCIGSSGHINYKRHPGSMRKMSIKLPARLVKSVRVLLEKYPVEGLTTKTQKLVRYLQARQSPWSDKEIAIKAREVEQKILEKDGNSLTHLEGEDLEIATKELETKVLAKLRTLIYHWQPMQYDAFSSYIYLMGRITPDYSVHIQCFSEISNRDPEFKPTSVYHFGSKVGSGVWAADKTWKGINEHYCVDTSGFMNTIARLLLQDGNDQSSSMSIKGVHFRQFSPSSKQNTFSLVLCPYMLMEQASDKERLQLVLDLWEMTENYLVLIENGTTAGFNLIDEARDFILQISKEDLNNPHKGHVFAPCPHDFECPKKRDKKLPCLTECVSNQVDFMSNKASERKTYVRYSYVIFKKGPRVTEMAWPRVLQHTKAKRHHHCHVCLPCGQLQHVVITKGKFEKHLYGCSRHINQGDFLPVQLANCVTEQICNNNNDENNDDEIDDNFISQGNADVEDNAVCDNESVVSGDQRKL